jgi:hypothetical protein
MFQSRFSYSVISSQPFRPLVITLLLANSLEVQAHFRQRRISLGLSLNRNGKLAPHLVQAVTTLFLKQLVNVGFYGIRGLRADF